MKNLAIIIAISICVIKKIRFITEIFLVGDSVTIMSDEWKSNMKSV